MQFNGKAHDQGGRVFCLSTSASSGSLERGLIIIFYIIGMGGAREVVFCVGWTDWPVWVYGVPTNVPIQFGRIDLRLLFCSEGWVFIGNRWREHTFAARSWSDVFLFFIFYFSLVQVESLTLGGAFCSSVFQGRHNFALFWSLEASLPERVLHQLLIDWNFVCWSDVLLHPHRLQSVIPCGGIISRQVFLGCGAVEVFLSL